MNVQIGVADFALLAENEAGIICISRSAGRLYNLHEVFTKHPGGQVQPPGRAAPYSIERPKLQFSVEGK